LAGWERRITHRYFFPDEDDYSQISRLKGYLYFFIALIYILFSSLYIFLFGVSLGPDATGMWLSGTGISFVMEVFILQPFRIFVVFILITSVTSKKVKIIHSVLRSRAKGIMTRTKGLMKDATALTQHINPACRASRQFPHLPMARLLMSLNDFDVPVDHLELVGVVKAKSWVWLAKLGAQLFILAFVIFISALFLIPEDIGDGILDSVGSVFIGGIMGVFYWISEIHIAISISVGISSLILFGLYQYKKHQADADNKWSLISPVEQEDEAEEDKSDDLLAAMKPRVKKLQEMSWRKKFEKKMKSNFGSYFTKFNPDSSPAAGAGSPKKEELKIKLWPELEKSHTDVVMNNQPQGIQTAPELGTYAAKRLERLGRRAQKGLHVVSSLEAAVGEHDESHESDVLGMFDNITFDDALSKKKDHIPLDETSQERLARLNPNARSAVLSRSAIRAFKKEEKSLTTLAATTSTNAQPHNLANLDALMENQFDDKDMPDFDM
jgi:hypothetical protein